MSEPLLFCEACDLGDEVYYLSQVMHFAAAGLLRYSEGCIPDQSELEAMEHFAADLRRRARRLQRGLHDISNGKRPA